MKIEYTGSVPAPQSNTPSSQSEGRARALNALLGASGSPVASVPNQSQISVESLAAASPEKKPEEEIPEQTLEASEPTSTETQDDTSEEVTKAPKEELLSTQHAVIARKEKALRIKIAQQEQSFKTREAALAAREAEISSKNTQDLNNFVSKDSLKKNAFSVLKDLGVDYDTLSQQAIMAQSPEYQTIQELRREVDAELQKVREEQAKSKQSYEQQQAESYQQALRQIETEARQLVKSDPAFEMIRETKQEKEVVKLIERVFKEDGELLTVERAAELVEEAIAEEAMKVSRIGKIQNRLKSAQEANAKKTVAQQPAKDVAQTQSPQTPKSPTLTNSMASTRPLTAKERALLAFKGQLNQK